MNWADVRKDYPALCNCTWLNTATFGQVSLGTQAAVARHFARRNDRGGEDFLGWFDDMDELRGLIAELIGCQPDDIAFTMNTASALSLFLGGIDWRPGDRVVTLENEFPNQFYYANWLGLRGVELLEMPEIALIPARTRAIAISTVSYITGARPDLAAICRLAREAGALVYIDGTQSLGALQFDVAAVQPDMFAVDGYKWLLSPNGATFFYASPSLRRTLPPSIVGWRSDKGWRSVNELSHSVPAFPAAAERYEGGMLNFPSLYGMAEAVRTVLKLGPAAIEARVLELGTQVAVILQESGGSVREKTSHIVSAHWPELDAGAIAKSLRANNIVVAARHGSVRVSPHFYNNQRDLEAFRAGMDRAILRNRS